MRAREGFPKEVGLGLGWTTVFRAAAGPASLARVRRKQGSLPVGLQLLLEDKKNSREMTPQPRDLPRMLLSAGGMPAACLQTQRTRGPHTPAASAPPHATPLPLPSQSTWATWSSGLKWSFPSRAFRRLLYRGETDSHPNSSQPQKSQGLVEFFPYKFIFFFLHQWLTG